MCDSIIIGQWNYTRDQYRTYLGHMQCAQPLPRDASHHVVVTRVCEETQETAGKACPLKLMVKHRTVLLSVNDLHVQCRTQGGCC